jgi:hypothetical protein
MKIIPKYLLRYSKPTTEEAKKLVYQQKEKTFKESGIEYLHYCESFNDGIYCAQEKHENNLWVYIEGYDCIMWERAVCRFCPLCGYTINK